MSHKITVLYIFMMLLFAIGCSEQKELASDESKKRNVDEASDDDSIIDLNEDSGDEDSDDEDSGDEDSDDEDSDDEDSDDEDSDDDDSDNDSSASGGGSGSDNSCMHSS